MSDGNPAMQIVEVFTGFYVNWTTLAFSVINFTVVLILLKKFAITPLQAILEKRKEMIADSVKKAEEVQLQLKNANEEKQRIIDGANKKATEIVESAKGTAELAKERILGDASREATGIKDKANEASISERNKLLKEAKAEIAELVMGVTENVIGRTLTGEDKTRINTEASKKIVAA